LPGGILQPVSVAPFEEYFTSRRFDLYFEPNFIPIHILADRIVTTVFDFSFVLFPEWHSRDKVLYFKKHFWDKIKTADRIIVISNFIKNEAINRFGFSKDRLTTIHLGFDHEIFKIYPPQALKTVKAQYRLPENFILFLGFIEPRKNLKRLLQAYTDLGDKIRKELKLVLIWFKGWENEEVMRLMQNLKSDIFYLGYLPGEELGKLYNLARLFVYPSLYEGFGLPPLEAMACGCPIIVSHTASLPEVCGDAAFYADPQDANSISGAILRVLLDENLRNSLIQKGFDRASTFSWEKSALSHLKVFEEVFSP
jgi:glycosyltransferase involved in cell wall biosynthesis